MTKHKPIRLIVLRFSALGDVAMCIPVLWSISKQFPNVEITFVSRNFARSLLNEVPGVRFFEFDPKVKHKGIIGILRLFLELKRKGPWDGIVDLHDVLRTKIIRSLFRFCGFRVSSINKGRKGKRLLTKQKDKQLIPQKHTVFRYLETFNKIGLNLDYEFGFKSLFSKPYKLSESETRITGIKEGKWIGIAPFAKHPGKQYPVDCIKQMIEELVRISYLTIMLFGAKGHEQKILEDIASQYPNIKNLAGAFSLDQELKVMSNLELMVSMDSANMHLASLVGIPVVSIWGATHPFAGFYGWNQRPENAIQIELECRPCSVFGDKPCFRKDFACLNRINPGYIAVRVVDLLNEKPS